MDHHGKFFSKIVFILTVVSAIYLFSPWISPSIAGRMSPKSLVSKVTLSGGIDAAALHSLNEKNTTGKRPLKKTTTSDSNRVDPTLIGEQLKKTLRKSLKTPLIKEDQQNNLRSLVLSKQDSGGVRVQFNRKNGTPTLIKGRAITPEKPGASGDIAAMESIARKFVVDNRNLLKISNPMQELKIKRQWADKIGTKHFRYQQTVNSVPIFGKELMVHLDKENSVYMLNGRYEATPVGVDTTPEITQEKALDLVMQHLNFTELPIVAPDTELVIYTHPSGDMTLTWKIDITPTLDQRWIYFISAKDGKFVHRIKNIHSAIVTARGTDLNSTIRSFNAWSESGNFFIIDPSTPTADPPYNPIADGSNPSGDTFILSADNGDGSSLFYVWSSLQTSGWDPTGVSAAYNTRQVYDYWNNTHGRDSLDDKGMNLMVAIHFKNNFDNAYWNGTWMVFGDGGTKFRDLAGSLDVTAHEMTHGVIEHTAGLIYENQSGALNESFADVFGVMVDRDDWFIGEDITIPSPGYARSMANPADGLPPQPAKMSEYQNLPNTNAGDHGGVHVNSGIPNRAAYLIAEGLTAESLGTSIGRGDTEQIYYRALTTYLTASSTFLDARNALVQAATDLFGAGSIQVVAVNTAFDVVEITSGTTSDPDDTAPTDTDTVAGDDVMAYLYPADETHDNPFDSNEKYALFFQNFSSFPPYDIADDTLIHYSPGSGANPRYTRPATFTDSNGTIALWVGEDFNVHAVDSTGSNYTQITATGDIWSIAISPDGRYVAFTPNIIDNNIYVYDINSDLTYAYPVVEPSYQEPGSTTTNTVLYADALAFDYTGNTIVFDFLNCFSTPESSCDATGGGYRYYSIGFLDISDLSNGSFFYPFPNQSPAFDIGFPAFAYNNNYVIALDVLDYSNFSTGGDPIRSQVWTLNRESQDSALVADTGIPTANDETFGVWGVPSFWGDDDYITMQRFNISNGAVSNGVVYRIPIDSSWTGDDTNREKINDYDAAMPIMHRVGVRDLFGDITTSATLLDLGNVYLGRSGTATLTLTNNGNKDLSITHLSIQGAAFSHNGTNTTLPRTQSMSITVTFTPGTTVGTQTGTLTITSDADNPTLVISLTGTGVDTLGDGWMTINGTVTYNGTPLCAMVLANGQYMFSCGENQGTYELEIPLDKNGEITLFAFVDGLAPFKVTSEPSSLPSNIEMELASPDSKTPTVTSSVVESIDNPGWVEIEGFVSLEGTPLCAMVLANGQYMFSCDPDGEYQLTVPLDPNGEITLFTFVDGLQPYTRSRFFRQT